MKASRFNRLFQAADGVWLAYNSWTTALAELEPADLAFIRAMLADPDGTSCDTPQKRGIREAMVEAHFLVDDSMDELSTLKADLMRDRFGREKLFLTIAPTLDCNFRCDYCYEDRLKITMARPMEDALVRWTRHQLQGSRELRVTWYGGEPLLPEARPVVERLSAAFQRLTGERELEYGAELVTNGYYLDRPTMQRLVELGVKTVQVTLDGSPAAHDARRHLADGSGTFATIVKNLQDVSDLARCQVRVNLDRRNAMATLEMIEALDKAGLRDVIRIYLAQVTVDGATCGNINELCYADKDYAEMEMEVYRAAFERGYKLARYPARIVGAYCQAERLHGYVIAPTGLIFKCWHEVTLSPERAVGSLLDEQQGYQKLNEDRWLGWNAMEKPGCLACDLAPMCHGGCPLEAMKHPERKRGSCDHSKYNLQGLLDLQYRYRGVGGGSPADPRADEARC